MTTRYATIGDLPAIVAIFNAAIPTGVTAETSPISIESRRAWFDEHAPERYPLWVEERDGEVVAWLSVSQYYRQSAYDTTGEVSVYVAPSHQRTGIARGLVTLALQTAPRLGLKTLVGYVWAHNEASLRLFETQGFERWGRLPRIAVLDGRAVDTVILGRHLEEGSNA
jgi:L-amino acid N-acyltransferase YncA